MMKNKKLYPNCNENCKNCDVRRDCPSSPYKWSFKRIASRILRVTPIFAIAFVAFLAFQTISAQIKLTGPQTTASNPTLTEATVLDVRQVDIPRYTMIGRTLFPSRSARVNYVYFSGIEHDGQISNGYFPMKSANESLIGQTIQIKWGKSQFLRMPTVEHIARIEERSFVGVFQPEYVYDGDGDGRPDPIVNNNPAYVGASQTVTPDPVPMPIFERDIQDRPENGSDN